VIEIPLAAKFTFGIFELGQHVLHAALAGSDWPVLTTLPVVAEAVDRDRLEPGAKRSDAAIMLKLHEPPHNDRHYFLSHIIHIVFGKDSLPQPATDEWLVDSHQVLPRVSRGADAEAFE
jgi:hypothetical protein